MSRRKSGHDEELPFVALMDTMTNVVGVLIIVLVMVGISLARSVNKVLSELPSVTQEQFDKLKKTLDEQKPKEDPKKVEQDLAKTQEALKKNVEQLKTLDITPESQKSNVKSLDELQKQLDQKKKERDTHKADVEKLIAEVDKLKAQLDTTPVYTPPPATVVKLPNPREMPQNAVLQRFLVAGGRIVYLNDEEFMKTVIKEIEKSQKTLIHGEEPVKDKDGKIVMEKNRAGKMVPKVKTIYDQQKLAEYFTKARIATRDLKLELVPAPTSSRIPMRLTPLPDAGETADQIKNPASVFQRAMRKFKTEPNTVVWFYVYKDSLDLYLAARELADQAGVPVGWEIYGSNYFQRSVLPFEVDYKPAPPPPATAVRIVAPKATLD